MEPEKPKIAKTILNKKRNTGGTAISDFNIYYTVIVIKITWFWQKTTDI